MATTVEFVRPTRDLIDNKGITAGDWAAIDIEHGDVWFNAANKYTVDASEFPTEVLDYFRSDPDYRVAEDGEESEQPVEGSGDSEGSGGN